MLTDPCRALAVVLCTLVAGIAGLLVVWHPTETSLASFALPSRMGSIPTWAGVVIIEFVAMGLAGLLSYFAACNHAATVSWTALAGGLTMVTLAAAAPNCNPVGSIALGLMIASVFAGVGWVIVWLSSNTDMPGANSRAISPILFVRCSTTAYMVIAAAFAVLMRFNSDINVDILGAILIFCGLGVTAAATLSEKWNSRNIIALLGVTISIVGAGIEMDRAFHTHAAPFEAWHVLLVVALMSMTLILPLAFHTENGTIRNGGLVLVTLFAGVIMFLMAFGMLVLIVGTCGVALSQAPWNSVFIASGLIGLGTAVCTYVVVRRLVSP